ncbi:hypothetical protein K438DRAFT_1984369 [Mycena galopus ATCC 62051]|nr:hypothetical protein K438DRAFT_1984369 [Mycena galopus ATCC 62051]
MRERYAPAPESPADRICRLIIVVLRSLKVRSKKDPGSAYPKNILVSVVEPLYFLTVHLWKVYGFISVNFTPKIAGTELLERSNDLLETETTFDITGAEYGVLEVDIYWADILSFNWVEIIHGTGPTKSSAVSTISVRCHFRSFSLCMLCSFFVRLSIVIASDWLAPFPGASGSFAVPPAPSPPSLAVPPRASFSKQPSKQPPTAPACSRRRRWILADLAPDHCCAVNTDGMRYASGTSSSSQPSAPFFAGVPTPLARCCPGPQLAAVSLRASYQLHCHDHFLAHMATPARIAHVDERPRYRLRSASTSTLLVDLALSPTARRQSHALSGQ